MHENHDESGNKAFIENIYDMSEEVSEQESTQRPEQDPLAEATWFSKPPLTELIEQWAREKRKNIENGSGFCECDGADSQMIRILDELLSIVKKNKEG